MAITKEQAADLVITGPGDVREKIIAGIEAYVGATAKGAADEHSDAWNSGFAYRDAEIKKLKDKVAVLVKVLEEIVASSSGSLSCYATAQMIARAALASVQGGE